MASSVWASATGRGDLTLRLGPPPPTEASLKLPHWRGSKSSTVLLASGRPHLPWHPRPPPPPPARPVTWRLRTPGASLPAFLGVASSSVTPPPPLAPRILRRGLARIPGDHFAGTEDLTTECFDPYAPDAPATCFAFDEKDLESEEAIWAMYGRWRSFYNVKRDHDDIVRRFVHFKDTARRVHEFNKSGKPYTWGLQIMGDLTPEEVSEFTRPKFSRRKNHQ
nr:uncharacterized protein LOC117849324 [Setaria viridis]